MLRSPLSISRTKIFHRGAIISNYFSYPSHFPLTFVRTGNYIEWNTGKKRTREGLIYASNYVPVKRIEAVPRADGCGGFHGSDPNHMSEGSTQIGIPSDDSLGRSPTPTPAPTRTLMKLLQSRGVAPSRAPVRHSPEHHLAAARHRASTRRTMQGPRDFIPVAVAAMQVAANVDENCVRHCLAMAADRLAD